MCTVKSKYTISACFKREIYKRINVVCMILLLCTLNNGHSISLILSLICLSHQISYRCLIATSRKCCWFKRTHPLVAFTFFLLLPPFPPQPVFQNDDNLIHHIHKQPYAVVLSLCFDLKLLNYDHHSPFASEIASFSTITVTPCNSRHCQGLLFPGH